MKLAAQLYTLREFTQNKKDFLETLKKVKAMGYTSAQLSGAGPIIPEEVRSMTDEVDLPISATHIPHDMFVNHLDQVINNHKILACKYVGLGSMPKEYTKSPKDLQIFIDTYSKISETLAKEDLRFVYHNHNFEFFKFDDKTIMDILLENTSKDFFFELDTYWVQAGGADPVEWLEKTKDRCDYIHYKDMGVNRDFKTVFLPIGMGNLNWKKIIDASIKANVKYCAVELDSYDGSVFEALDSSYKYLSALGLK